MSGQVVIYRQIWRLTVLSMCLFIVCMKIASCWILVPCKHVPHGRQLHTCTLISLERIWQAGLKHRGRQCWDSGGLGPPGHKLRRVFEVEDVWSPWKKVWCLKPGFPDGVVKFPITWGDVPVIPVLWSSSFRGALELHTGFGGPWLDGEGRRGGGLSGQSP